MQCTYCAGVGLVGQGDTPTKLEGDQRTCPECSGTGTLEDLDNEIVPEIE